MLTNSWKLLLAGGVFILAIIIAIGVRIGNDNGLQTLVIEERDIFTQVSFSGTVTPADRVTLALEVSGRIDSLPVTVGDEVSQGEVLVELERRDVAASVLEAQAQLQTQEARLAELLRGTRSEALAVAAEEVRAQEVAVDDAETTLYRSTRDALTTLEGIIFTQTGPLFDNVRGVTPELRLEPASQSIEMEEREAFIEDEAARFVDVLEELRRDIGVSGTVMAQERNVLEEMLNAADVYLAELRIIVEDARPDAAENITQTTLDTWEAMIQTARESLGSAQSALVSANTSLRQAGSRLGILRYELSLLEAGATTEELAQQEARVQAGRAAVQRAQAAFADHEIRAPFAGIISERFVDPGELVQAGNPVVELLSGDTLEIEADASELDVTNIVVGAQGEITFDAFAEDLVLPVEVALVDPAESIENGVPVYGVTLRLLEEDPRIRPGLTANITLVQKIASNVPVIRQEMLVAGTTTPAVRLRENGTTRIVPIELGARGFDGTLEVRSPLKAGQIIVRPE